MSHQRQVIRAAVVSLLQAAATGGQLAGVSAANVTQTRLAPQREAQLPSVSVYTLDESVTEDSYLSAPRKLTRLLNLAIEGWVKVGANGAPDNALDDLALAIETAVQRDPTLGGQFVANDIWLGPTQIAMKLDGNFPMGAVHLGYTVRYFTFAPETADVPMQPFEAFDTNYNLNNAQLPADQAKDSVDGLG